MVRKSTAQPPPPQPPDDEQVEEVTEEQIASVAGTLNIPGTTASSEEPEVEAPIPEHLREQANLQEAASADPMMERLTAAMEAIARKQEGESRESQPSGNPELASAMALLANAITRMTDNQLKGAQMIADATKKAQRPSNEFPPNISVFNLRGDKDFPKPRLKCEVLMPWPADWDSMTREECELVNLLQAGEFRIKRVDNTYAKLQVRIITRLDSDDPSRIIINHDTAFNNDYHRLMPPDWIRQLVTANPKTKLAANKVLTMEEEAALILAGQFNDGRKAEEGEKLVSVGE